MRRIGQLLFYLGYPLFVVFRSIFSYILDGFFVIRRHLLRRKSGSPKVLVVPTNPVPVPKKVVESPTAVSLESPFVYEWFTVSCGPRCLWKRLRFELHWWFFEGKGFTVEVRVGDGVARKSQGKQMSSPLRQSARIFFVLMTMWGVLVSSQRFYSQILYNLPDPQLIRSHQPAVSTKIYDREGNLLYKVFKNENRTVVPLSEISPYLKQATLAIEDEQFYEHWGVSFRGITRAFVHNFQSETTHGGSTITQQLVKNVLLSPERTWERKIKEAILAVAVDSLYTKDEILENYLNEVNYGGSIYGIEEASQWFFGKSARDLTLGESALIAGLPQSPTTNNPYGTHPEKSVARQREVLQRMVEVGFITPEQRSEAESAPLNFQTATYDIKSPHFVMFVRDWLAQQFGEEMVREGGLEVYTTLDPAVQASAEAAIASELSRLTRLNVTNGASLVTNPRSGEILAMVGSRDYFDREHDGQVNVTLRPRQPGSSIKPLTYALAFENGFTPASTIEDSPVVYTAPGAPPYAPKNYDGRFHGTVTLRQALANSYNVPAVRLLVQLGVGNLVQKGQQLGISTWGDSSRFGLSLTLGSGEVTMYDMARVYGTFANSGENVALNPIREVRNYKGQVLYRNPCSDAVEPCNGESVLSPLAAFHVTSVLSDNQARSSAFGTNSVLHIPNQQVAVKTGTTNDLRDNWTIGYTSDRLVVTWVGNNDNSRMSSVVSGITGASPIWNTIMRSQLENRSHEFALPPQMEKVKICALTKTLACSACPNVVEEVFLRGQAPKQVCNDEQIVRLLERTSETVVQL